MTYGCFPKLLRDCILQLIPKPGKDPTCSDNYRPIALAPTLSKVLEWCILLIYGDSFSTSPLQFGFKPSMSADMCTGLNKNGASKAFGRVSHLRVISVWTLKISSVSDRSERKIWPWWQALSTSLRDWPANREVSEVDGLGEQQGKENLTCCVFPGLNNSCNHWQIDNKYWASFLKLRQREPKEQCHLHTQELQQNSVTSSSQQLEILIWSVILQCKQWKVWVIKHHLV